MMRSRPGGGHAVNIIEANEHSDTEYASDDAPELIDIEYSSVGDFDDVIAGSAFIARPRWIDTLFSDAD
jgi:hypothetical protein